MYYSYDFSINLKLYQNKFILKKYFVALEENPVAKTKEELREPDRKLLTWFMSKLTVAWTREKQRRFGIYFEKRDNRIP